MITLPKTLQTIFNIVAIHLMTQMACSRDKNNAVCYYRGEGGLKCAAGALIKDEEYTEDLEQNSWDTLVHCEKAPREHSSHIRRLQIIHDMHDPSDWKRLLKEFADEKNLDEPDCLN